MLFKKKIYINFSTSKEKLINSDILILKKITNYIFLYFKLEKNNYVELEIISDNEMKELNWKYKNKQKITDVLSFKMKDEIEKKCLGTIFIAYTEIAKFSKKTFTYNLVFLFIHGFLHILNYDHGCEMENLEKIIISKFF